MLDGHGDDIHKYDIKIKHNFSSNVYYGGCSQLLIDKLNQSLGNIENYPSPSAYELSELAALKFDLAPFQFLFTNGATEAFYMICQSFYGSSATIVGPTFSEYQDACTYSNVETTFLRYENIDNHDFNTQLAFICNPNNPDGSFITSQLIEKLLKTSPQTTFVIDEAYIEFSDIVTSSIQLLNLYDNLIIIKSLTKTFGIPGLRLGYIISTPAIIDKLILFKMPWSVNSLAIAAGKFIFNHYEDLLFDIKQLITETKQLRLAIEDISYLETLPSNTTFFLTKLKNRKVSDLKSYLINEHQILIRDATNFIGLEGQYMRLAVQKNDANIALINALKQWT